MEKKFLYWGAGGIAVVGGLFYMFAGESAEESAPVADTSPASGAYAGTPVAVYASGAGASGLGNNADTGSVAQAITAADAVTSGTNADDVKSDLIDSGIMGNIIDSLTTMGNRFSNISLTHTADGGVNVGVTANSELNNAILAQDTVSKTIDAMVKTGKEFGSITVSNTASGGTSVDIGASKTPVTVVKEVVVDKTPKASDYAFSKLDANEATTVKSWLSTTFTRSLKWGRDITTTRPYKQTGDQIPIEKLTVSQMRDLSTMLNLSSV